MNTTQASLRFAANFVLDLNGENAQATAERIEKAVYEATFGNGVVTGSSSAEVNEHDFDVVLLAPEAVRIDEGDLADWLSHQIEGGHIALEDVPKLMARYALVDPAEMRNEFAERMFPQAIDTEIEASAG
ncbi:MAG: hypothetical protein O9327_02550 [Polaromonas sp.]|nr:hypothetical protein [Polaromonas sp.]